MIKNLIKLADHLDAKGLNKEADYVDHLISIAIKKKKKKSKKDKKWPDWNGFGMPPWFKKRKKKNDARDPEHNTEDKEFFLRAIHYVLLKGESLCTKKFIMTSDKGVTSIDDMKLEYYMVCYNIDNHPAIDDSERKILNDNKDYIINLVEKKEEGGVLKEEVEKILLENKRKASSMKSLKRLSPAEFKELEEKYR